ncbi:UNVERIFIED_ORG: hypothetical protein J2740_004622 [Rhizobium nepotum]|nr:hypothetical protein [Rhizobium nepotum]
MTWNAEIERNNICKIADIALAVAVHGAEALSLLKDGALTILTSSTSISGTAALAVVLGNFVA